MLTQASTPSASPRGGVSLLRPDHHVGLGKSHQVTEAWIDDLGGWVVLDGQNRAWWTDADGRPLSALTQAWRARGDRPAMKTPTIQCDGESAGWWFEHFATVCSTGVTFAPGSFVPVFQGKATLRSPQLVRDPTFAEPDLRQITTGVVDLDGPALAALTPAHPFAVGVSFVGDSTMPDQVAGVPAVLPLSRAPGEYRLTVATSTRYGTLRGHPLIFVAR